MQINPYLNFAGDCEAAFTLYARLFDGKILFKMTHGESPMAAHSPADWQDKIMHASLAIGGQTVQGMDAPPARYQRPSGMRLSVTLTDQAEAKRIFAELSDGGEVQMPLESTFWAPLFGMLVDRFGTPWMINCEAPTPAS